METINIKTAPKIEVISENVISMRVTKEFSLQVGKDKKEVTVEKWWVNSEDEVDVDYEIIEGAGSLTDEEAEELVDFVEELSN